MTMKRIFIIFTLLLGFWMVGCTSFGENPYAGDLQRLNVTAVYPEEYAEYQRSGVQVRVQEVSSGNRYTALTDEHGKAELKLANGIYRISIFDMPSDEVMFNGSADRIQVIDRDREMTLGLVFSRPSDLVIKEIYCGGCSKAPEQGTYNTDQYVILHNNSFETLYLDGLCFGALDPYNSSSGGSVWVTKDPITGETIFPKFVPIIQAIWTFGGTGESFPLAPGADAVVSITGAIDHAAKYPESVNLNKSGYFVCYNPVYFPSPTYHPAPGNQIQSSHYLDVAIKLGQASAYTYSMNSPATVIFRPQGMTLEAFLADPANVVQKPGGNSDKCALVPEEWVIDGVEVFTTPSDPVKRLQPQIDASFTVLTTTKKSHTLHRKLNEEMTASVGYEVYWDTNNSSNDFYERETQSLRQGL